MLSLLLSLIIATPPPTQEPEICVTALHWTIDGGVVQISNDDSFRIVKESWDQCDGFGWARVIYFGEVEIIESFPFAFTYNETVIPCDEFWPDMAWVPDDIIMGCWLP